MGNGGEDNGDNETGKKRVRSWVIGEIFSHGSGIQDRG
jgi:hypothetical protein